MPTLPLFDASVTAPVASHRVTAPGGYEVWRFAARDPVSETSVCAHFHHGFPCHEYLRRYDRFRQSPTRVSPPIPQEYPAISICVYARNRSIANTIRFDRIPSTAGETGIQIGAFRIVRQADLAIRLLAPHMDLMFLPRFSGPPIQVAPPKLHANADLHQWVLTDGLCDVSGEIDLGESKIAFNGTGFHDQQYGTAPRRFGSFSGHLFLKDKALIFQLLDEAQIATAGPASLSIQRGVAGSVPLQGATRWGLRYPRSITLNNGLRLEQPRVIDSKSLSAMMAYQATCDGEKGVAICQVLSPPRLRWPIVGRLIDRGDAKRYAAGDLQTSTADRA